MENNNNDNWEDIKYTFVSDRWGNYISSNTYSSANIYRIDPRIEYHYLPEEEYDKELHEESKKEILIENRKRQMIKEVLKITAKLTETQQSVLVQYLEGKSIKEIAKNRNSSKSAVRQVLRGNSQGQGGIIRKIKKLLKDP